nr:reverse transcriptase domain-containing protein [Tanacetum cinerariifolium]
MSTRSSAKNLFPPLDNHELTIRRRSRSDPTLLNNSKMAAEGNGDLPVPDLRTMKELYQASLNGRVQNSCQFHGLSGDGANKHLDKFLHVTQSIKVNGVTDDALRLYLFPHSLTHYAIAWFDRLPRNSINTFEQMAKMFLGKYFSPSMVTKLRNEITNFRQCPDESLFEAWERTSMKRRPEECYDLIENMTTHHNDWDTSDQRITPNYETCGGPRSFSDCPATVGNTQNVYAAGAYQVVTTNEFTNFMKANDVILKNMQTNMTSLTNSNIELKNMFGMFMKINTASSSGSKTLSGNTITNPKEDLKGITTRRGTTYPGPTIPTISSSLVVERETGATKDTVHPTNNGSTEDVQPSVVLSESPILTSESVNSPIIEPVASLVSALRPNQRPSIPYPFRFFADALILMPKFGPSIKSLLTNKDKLCELARTPLNEHYSAVLLKKLLEKLGDPDKFLIPSDFLGMAECLALADHGASINLMSLSVWNKLSLPDLSPTCMTLELADRLISRPVGVAEDVFVKVVHFIFWPTSFVDFDADPRVPLILRRTFLKTGRALIDVFEGELAIRVGKKAITFNLDQTSRYSANYNDMTAKRIDIIDLACEEYSQEVISFSNVITSGNPTPYYDLIVSTTSSTLTLFGNSDFFLEEVDAFLTLEDDPTSPEVDQSYLDSEGDILLLEAFLNDDPSLPPPNQENYLPEVRKELKICEAKSDKSLIDEPLEVELKDLPPHLEYAFLKSEDKLPFIIAKDLSVEEKTA